MSASNAIDTTNGGGAPAGADITLSADQMTLSDTVNGGTGGIVTLEPVTSSHSIDLGTNPSAGNLGLAQTDLDEVTAGLLVIGGASTGTINFSNNITDAGTGWTDISLENGTAGITETGGALTAATLSVLSSGDVELDGGTFNSVPTIAASLGGTGTIDYVSTVSVVVGTSPGPTGNVAGITSSGGIIAIGVFTNSLTVSNPIDSNDGDIDLSADAMTLSASVNGGTGIVTLAPATVAQIINLGGANAAGTLGLSDTELDEVTASVLPIGDIYTPAASRSAAPSAGTRALARYR